MVDYYCSTCHKEISLNHQTYIGDELLCQMCADKLVLQMVQTRGFILSLDRDFGAAGVKEENGKRYDYVSLVQGG